MHAQGGAHAQDCACLVKTENLSSYLWLKLMLYTADSEGKRRVTNCLAKCLECTTTSTQRPSAKTN